LFRITILIPPPSPLLSACWPPPPPPPNYGEFFISSRPLFPLKFFSLFLQGTRTVLFFPFPSGRPKCLYNRFSSIPFHPFLLFFSFATSFLSLSDCYKSFKFLVHPSFNSELSLSHRRLFFESSTRLLFLFQFLSVSFCPFFCVP